MTDYKTFYIEKHIQINIIYKSRFLIKIFGHYAYFTKYNLLF
jgi:hypothetical protein